MKKMRVALLGIYHETNIFIDAPTTLDDFKNGYWLEGEVIREPWFHTAPTRTSTNTPRAKRPLR